MKKLELLLIFCVWFLMACRKDMIPSVPAAQVSQHKISELKSWYESHKKTAVSTNRDEFILPEQAPIWDSTLYHSDGSVYTTPLQKEGADPNVTRSLVLEVDANGNIISGEYTFIRLTNAPGNLTPAQVLASYPKVFDFTDMPDNFKASMLKYNLNGEIIYAKHFDNHVITDTDEKIKSTERAPVALPDEGIEICIDSWWVTYYSDGTYTIEYLWSECFIVGGTGSGGGNGGSSNVCQLQLDAICDEAHSVSEIKPASILSQTTTTTGHTLTQYNIPWTIFDGITWFITSHEHATIDTWYNVNTNSITKQFTSFVHAGTTTSGWNLPTISRTYTVSPPIISFGTLQTTEVINFTVKTTLANIPILNCGPLSKDISYTSTGVFVASQL